jgi:hypothetical protein
MACLGTVSPGTLAAEPAEWLWQCRLNQDGSNGCVQPYAEGLAAVRTVSPAHEYGLWGFIDLQGRMAIAPRFTEVDSFSQGLAAANEGGKWGYINPKGDWVIPPQFDEAGLFNAKGFAFVFSDGAHHLINRTGQRVKKTPPLHLYWSPGRAGDLASVTVNAPMQLWNRHNGQRIALPTDIGEVHPPQGGLIPAARPVTRGTRPWGALHPDLSWAAPPEQLLSDMPPVHHAGVFHVRRNSHSLFVNAQGETLRPANYSSIELLVPGIWVVETFQPQQQQLLLDAQLRVLHTTGSMSEEGQRIHWQSAGPWHVAEQPNGLLLVHQRGTFLHLPYKNAKAHHSHGRLWITREEPDTQNPEWGFSKTRLVQAVDDTGQAVLTPEILHQLRRFAVDLRDSHADPTQAGWVVATLDPDEDGVPPAVLTAQGQVLTAPDWAEVSPGPDHKHQVLVVSDAQGVSRLVGADGRVLTTQGFKLLSRFDNGLAWAYLPNQDGRRDDFFVLHESGKMVPIADRLRQQCDRTILWGQLVCSIQSDDGVRTHHLWNPLTGERSKYDYAQLDALEDAPAGHFRAAQGDQWGVINAHGEWLLPPTVAYSHDIKALTPHIIQITDHSTDPVKHRLLALATGKDLAGPLQQVQKIDGGGIEAVDEKGATLLLNETGQVQLRLDMPGAKVQTRDEWVIVAPPALDGLMDGEGNWVTPAAYTEITHGEGLASLRVGTRPEGRSEVLDATGRVIRTLPEHHWLFLGHRLIVMSNTKTDTHTVLNEQWQEAGPLPADINLTDDHEWQSDPDSPELVRHAQTERYGYMSPDGKLLVSPVFDFLELPRGGRARAKQTSKFGDKIGFVDRLGQFVITPQYERATVFRNQRALVMRQHQLLAIDPQGQVTTRFSVRCDQFVIQDSQGVQSWPSQPLSCAAPKATKKRR